MLRRHPQIYMPEGKEPWFFASELRPALPAAAQPDAAAQRSRSTWRCSTRPAPEQRVGEASPSTSGRAPPPRAIARGAARRAHHRDPARAGELPALAAPAVRCRPTSRRETDLRKALALEDARREGSDIPRTSHWPQVLLYSEHVRYVEQLRRYHARVPAASRCWC